MSVYGPIYLHLGAHRTGTTQLQAILDLNADKLIQTGVDVLTPPRIGKRGGLTIRSLSHAVHRSVDKPSYLKRWRAARQFSSDLNNLFSRNRSLIISDEVLIGNAFDDSGFGLYRNCLKYLRAWREFVPANVERVCFKVRCYSTFIPSFYAMSVVFGSNRNSYEQFNAQAICLHRRWFDVVSDIRAVFKDSEILVAQHEVSTQKEFLTKLVAPIEIDELSVPEDAINAAPTLQAIEYARSVRASSAQRGDQISALFADGDKFDPLSSSEKSALSDAYYQDLDRIARLSGVSVAWT